MDNPQSAIASTETAAHKNFTTNLGRLSALIKLLTRDLRRSNAALEKSATRQVNDAGRVAHLASADTRRLNRTISKLIKTLKKHSDEMSIYVQAKGLVLYDWSAVMLVTFIEAYLEEGLVELARKNPKLLKSISAFDWRRVFEIDAMEELRGEVRRQWAHDALRPNGPQTWVEWLHTLGARGYNKKSMHGVQHLWDTRNLIVHNQGVANAAYIKKYPAPPLKVGDRITVSSSQFKSWTAAVDEFVTPTEQFFSRYKAPANNHA